MMHDLCRLKNVFVMVSVFTIIITFSCFGGQDHKNQHPKGVFDIYDYAATGDGTTLDTKAIQAAINDCATQGGGKVYLHNGTFLSGTLFLKDYVTLYIESGATLLGSGNLDDYPVTIPEYRSFTDIYTNKSLIYAEKKKNIGIAGAGTIDGQGASFPLSKPWIERPFLMRFIECRHVTVQNITCQNSSMFIQHYLACDDVIIDRVRVDSIDINNDGINIDSCHKVCISNCNIRSGDDAICLKSTSDRSCKNITITNCVLSSGANAIKTGTESNGGFENITISNCTIYNTVRCGIALELVDGGRFDKVSISNINMDQVGSAIFIRLGNRARPFKKDQPKPGMGSMQNIIISNIQATVVDHVGDSITGLPGHPVKNVTLQNIAIKYKGGQTAMRALSDIPEQAELYPRYMMFGTLPAYGLFCRHVQNLNIDNLQLEFENNDARPALVFDDVKGLDIFRLNAKSSPQASAVLWLNQVEDALIHGCQPQKTNIPFLHITGDKTDNISVMNNNLAGLKQILKKDKDIKANAVVLLNNRTH